MPGVSSSNFTATTLARRRIRRGGVPGHRLPNIARWYVHSAFLAIFTHNNWVTSQITII